MTGFHFRGSCRCGHCAYACDAAPTRAGHCHCTICQTLTGAAFMTAFRVPTASVRWQHRPTAKVSSRTAERLACDRCHSWMAMSYTATPNEIFLNHSTVDYAGMAKGQVEAFRPTYHIFVADKAPWLQIDDNLEQFEGDNEVERPVGEEAAKDEKTEKTTRARM